MPKSAQNMKTVKWPKSVYELSGVTISPKWKVLVIDLENISNQAELIQMFL